MRRCPKCNTVFEDDRIYCTSDGATLVAESFGLPSDATDDEPEQQTVIRARPIPIPREQAVVTNTPAAVPTPPKQGSCLKYAFVLIIGVLLGGILIGLVLGGAYFYFLKIGSKPNVAPSAKKEKNLEGPSDMHEGRNSRFDELKLNGKVIVAGAKLHAAPSKTAKITNNLPIGDRVVIVRRRSSTSPWYYVECEHESKGWIHGNSIAYTK